MKMADLRKRDFLTGGLMAAAAATAANAQMAGPRPGMAGPRPGMAGPKPEPMPPPVTNVSPKREIPHRMVKTTRLFKSPPGYVNALAVAPEGLWLGQQKLSGDSAKRYGVPEPSDLHEAAWLVDWNGKLLKTVQTNSRNTSGMAYGNGCVWMMANQPPQGVFQVDMNGKEISHRQIPLNLPGQDGGGSHGAQWHNGKLWIVANRPRLMLRVDPKTYAHFMAVLDQPPASEGYARLMNAPKPWER